MPTFSESAVQTAAIVIAIAQAGLVVAMAYWASGGQRWLHSHWGGFYDELPIRLRISDAVSGTVFAIGIVVAVVQGWSADPPGYLTAVAWAFGGLLGISGVMNLASSSKYERYVFAPLAIVLALCWIVVARGG